MNSSFVSESSLDYLLIQIVANRSTSSETAEESNEKMRRIGYDLGARMTERFSTLDDTSVTQLEYAIKYLMEAPWCKHFFNDTVCRQIGNSNKTYILTIPSSQIINPISSFASSDSEVSSTVVMYINFIMGVIGGSLRGRGFKVNVSLALLRVDSGIRFDVKVTEE